MIARILSIVPARIQRYLQFCIAGGTGLIVDMTILYFLASPHALDWNLTVSKVIAAEIATCNNFLWNEFWTFRDLTAHRASLRHRAARFFKFNMICGSGLILSVLLLNFQVSWLRINFILANLISVIIVSLWNYLLNLRMGWGKTASWGFPNPMRAH